MVKSSVGRAVWPGRGREGLCGWPAGEAWAGRRPELLTLQPDPVGRAGPAALGRLRSGTRPARCPEPGVSVPRSPRPEMGSQTLPAWWGPRPGPRRPRRPHSPSSSSFSSPRSRFFCSRRSLLISWSMRAAAFSSSVKHQGQQLQVSEWAMVGASAGTRRHGPGPGEGTPPGRPGEGSWPPPRGASLFWGGSPPGTPDFPASGTERPAQRGLSAWHRRAGAGGGAQEGVEVQGSPPISRPARPALPNWLRVGAPGEGGLPSRKGPGHSQPPAAPAGPSFLILEKGVDSILPGPLTPPPGWPRAHPFFPSTEPIRRHHQKTNNDLFQKTVKARAPMYESSCYPPCADEQTEARSQEVTRQDSPDSGGRRTRQGWESAGPRAPSADQAALGRGCSFFLQIFAERLLRARQRTKGQNPGLPA